MNAPGKRELFSCATNSRIEVLKMEEITKMSALDLQDN